MEKVTADSSIIETVQLHPEIIDIFMQYGLGCIGCMAANFETIGQGASAHGCVNPFTERSSFGKGIFLRFGGNRAVLKLITVRKRYSPNTLVMY